MNKHLDSQQEVITCINDKVENVAPKLCILDSRVSALELASECRGDLLPSKVALV